MNTDILISGAGVVGLSAALAMAQRGFSTAIADTGDFSMPGEEDFQRMYAINAASAHLLRDLGVWQVLDKANCTPYQAMEVRDSRSDGQISFDCRNLALPELGHIIGECSLKKALLERVQQETRIQCLPAESIQHLRQTPSTLQITSNHQTIETRLLMVAEGAHSSTRDLLGVKQAHWSYHQHALVARIQCEKPHKHTARQIFTAGGPLAFLPLPDPHQCSIVWSCPPSRANYLKNLPEDVFNQALAEAFQQQAGHTTCLSPRLSFPLHMRHVKQYSGEHWLLLGDTAHSIHPLAGLGLNLGLADLQSFCTMLNHHPLSRKTLNTWQRGRKTEVWKVIAVMQGLKSLFQSPIAPVAGLRGLGLNLVNQCHPLKHFFMRQAIGQ